MVLLGGNSTKMIDIARRGMTAASYRNRILNNNIANATTPNYKRQDITFQAELGRALNTEKNYPGTPMKVSRQRHMPGFRIKNYQDVQAKKIVEHNTYQNNNGNSVDIDQEMIEATKNTMYYNALVQRTNKEFTKLKYLLRS